MSSLIFSGKECLAPKATDALEMVSLMKNEDGSSGGCVRGKGENATLLEGKDNNFAADGLRIRGNLHLRGPLGITQMFRMMSRRKDLRKGGGFGSTPR